MAYLTQALHKHLKLITFQQLVMPQLLPNLLPKLPLQVGVTWELTLKSWATVTSASHMPWVSVSIPTLSGYKASPPTQVLVTSCLLPATTQPRELQASWYPLNSLLFGVCSQP